MVTLTESEKKVLSAISFHTEEIENGNLCDDDIKLLNEMRTVHDYLSTKYPSYTFEITGCEPKSGTTRTYSEWYYNAAEIDRDSAFIAMSEETETGYEIKDAFFGQIIKDSIAQNLMDLLTSKGFPVIFIDISFWEYLGKEYDESISVSKVLSGEIQAGNDFKIFLDDTKLTSKDYKKTLEKIKECLMKSHVSGEIYLVVLKDAESDIAKDRLFSGSILLD